MFSLSTYKVGMEIDVLYPKNGFRNVLRKVRGEIVATGNGLNGHYITVKEKANKFRTLSLKKVVVMG